MSDKLEYTTLYEILHDKFPPSRFYDTAREKYQADLLDQAEEREQHLKGVIFVMGWALVVSCGLAALFALQIIGDYIQ